MEIFHYRVLAMKTLVVGAGAIGGYFGGRLAAAGCDVNFLIRAVRATALAQRGLVILSPQGNAQVPVRTVTANDLKADYELVFLACKAPALASVIGALEPAISADTVIVPLLNGVLHLEALDSAFGADRVAGGMCHLSARLGPAGEIVHLNALHEITLGERHASQVPVIHRAHDMLLRAGVDARHTPEIIQMMWEKYVFITALAALTSLMRADMGAILQTQHGRALAEMMLDICRRTAEASGHPPDARRLQAMAAPMFLTNSPLRASMARDIENGAATEAEHLVGHMAALAEHHGIDSTLLRAALTHLQAYEIQRSSHE